MTRKKIVAGNWKMNNGLQETELLINELAKETNHSGCEVMIAPSFVNLKTSFGRENSLRIQHLTNPFLKELQKERVNTFDWQKNI